MQSTLTLPRTTTRCHRCGTELHDDGERPQQYVLEAASDPADALAGQLCTDCLWELKEWLGAR